MSAAPSKFAHLIANTKSGKGVGSSLPDLAKQIAQAHGYTLTHYPTEDREQFEAQVERAALAAKADGGIVIGAGGDGTIRSVAQKAAETGATFAAVACGTFNFFARNHCIPETAEDALKLAFTGEVRPVRLGWINGKFFLINASLGLYAKSIREREKSTKRFGRARLVVILSTLKSLLSRHRNMEVAMITGEQRQTVHTLSIFIGNNALQLRDLSMDVARCMKRELLAVVLLKPVSRWGMLRILWRGIAKTLEREDRLDMFCVDSLKIHLPHRKMMVALDGEIFTMDSPLEVKAMPKVLNMVLPPKVEA